MQDLMAEPRAVNMSPEFDQKIHGVSTILLMVRDNIPMFCHRERKKPIVYILAPPVTHSNGSAVTYHGGLSQWAMQRSHSVVGIELICNDVMNMVMQWLFSGDKTRTGCCWLSFCRGWRENKEVIQQLQVWKEIGRIIRYKDLSKKTESMFHQIMNWQVRDNSKLSPMRREVELEKCTSQMLSKEDINRTWEKINFSMAGNKITCKCYLHWLFNVFKFSSSSKYFCFG